MKSKISILLLIVCVISGCGGDPLDDSGYFSDFIVENNSNYNIEVEYEVPSSVEESLESFFLEPGNSETFHTAFNETSNIANAPSPESTFLHFEIYRIDEEQRDNSIGVLDDSLWVKATQDKLSIYTLSIIDSDFGI